MKAWILLLPFLLFGSAFGYWGTAAWDGGEFSLQFAHDTFMELDGDTATGIYLFNNTQSTAVVDGTTYFKHLVAASTSAAAAAEVTGSSFGLNWNAGDNANNTYNALEGVFRSLKADESVTGRGVYARFYIDPTDATTTLRTGIGGEFSARASYSGGTEIAAESGTAFVGSRIWMAPYFSAATVDNVNNFHGLWIYGEHATQKNATNAIYVSDAGGGYGVGLNLAATSWATNIIAGSGTLATASSGTHTLYDLAGTINDSGTAGYIGVKIYITETATGSGAKRPLQVTVGSTDIAWIDNGGKFVSGIAAGNHAAAPQFAFIDGTGWYLSSAGTMQLSIAGNARAYFDNNKLYGNATGACAIHYRSA